MFRSLKWEDWAGIALGLWLFFSPSLFGYAGSLPPATVNAMLVGAALSLAELVNLEEHENLEEWFDMALGAWLMASPLVLGFDGAAASNAFAVGALVIALAGWALSPADRELAAWLREHLRGR